MKLKFIILSMSILLCFAMASCRPNGGKSADRSAEKPLIMVTIEPVRYFTEAIAGEYFRVVSMVPAGSSPESYDPTPQQLVDLSRCKAYFRIGYIGFEQAWMNRLTDNTPHLQVFDLSRGIDLIYAHEHAAHSRHTSTDEHHHHGGVEPHIWTSAVNARHIAANVRQALCTIDAEHADVYKHRFDSLYRCINHIDSAATATFMRPTVAREFMIYHPTLSYFARDYHLQQIAIEVDGKEPTPAALRNLIAECIRQKVKTIFVQPEFDKRNAEIIARETGARIVPVNPLAYDWQASMMQVITALADTDK